MLFLKFFCVTKNNKYCLPVLYPAITNRIGRICEFSDESSLELELEYDLDSLVGTHTKNWITQSYTDDEHYYTAVA